MFTNPHDAEKRHSTRLRAGVPAPTEIVQALMPLASTGKVTALNVLHDLKSASLCISYEQYFCPSGHIRSMLAPQKPPTAFMSDALFVLDCRAFARSLGGGADLNQHLHSVEASRPAPNWVDESNHMEEVDYQLETAYFFSVGTLVTLIFNLLMKCATASW